MPLRLPAALAGLCLLSACQLNPIVVGPTDLDTATATAPNCGGHLYPFYSLENHEQGTVVVRASVDGSGRVVAVDMDTPSRSTYLNAASLGAARHCRFPGASPYLGKSVRVTVAWELVGRDDNLPIGKVRIGVQPKLQKSVQEGG